MRKKILLLLGLLGGGAAQASPLLNGRDFTQNFVTYLSTTRSDLHIEVVQPLEIKAKLAERDLGTLYLNNVYSLYRQEPERKDELFSKYLSSLLDPVQEPPVLLETLVAVIKPKDWVDDMNYHSMGTEGKGFYILSEPLVGNLYIVYATDTPHSTSYRDSKEIVALEPSHQKLKEIGIANLRKVAGSYHFEHVEHDVYELRTTTGDYDSSLSLLAEVFEKFPSKKSDGDIVFAVPARNVLIATRVSNKEGIEYIQGLVQKIYNEGPYSISKSLFIIREGVWNVFKE